MKTKLTNMRIASLILVSALALMTTVKTNAQSVLKKFSYDLTLNGTSNIHDWKMKSSGANLDAYFTIDPSTKALEGISPLTFNMPVKGLKSNEGLMNSRAYDALKADKFPNITFKLISAKANGNTMNLAGQITVSGNTRDISLTANSVKNADGSYTLTGTKKLKMTELGVTPPKYMMGMMKVYDDISIDFSIKL